MSFGYLIITQRPCEVLIKTRGENFSLLFKQLGFWAYFRFDDSYTQKIKQNQSIITNKGQELLLRINSEIQEQFYFCDVKLERYESEYNFAQKIIQHQQNCQTISVISGQTDTVIMQNQLYQCAI